MNLLWFAAGILVAIGICILIAMAYSAGAKEGYKKAKEEEEANRYNRWPLRTYTYTDKQTKDSDN